MAIKSPISFEGLKNTVVQSSRATDAIKKSLTSSIRKKQSLNASIKSLKKKREEADERKLLQTRLLAPTYVVMSGGPKTLATTTQEGLSVGDRLIGFLKYAAAGWVLGKLPTWIGLGRNLVTRIGKAGSILSNYGDETLKAVESIGSIFSSIVSNISNADFLDESSKVQNSFGDLMSHIDELTTGFQDVLDTLTQPSEDVPPPVTDQSELDKQQQSTSQTQDSSTSSIAPQGTAGTFIEGSTGRSTGAHFHLGPGTADVKESQQGNVFPGKFYTDVRNVAFNVAKKFLGENKSFYLGRTRRTISPGISDSDLKNALYEEQRVHTAKGSDGGIDMSLGGGTRFPLVVTNVKDRRDGFGYSGTIQGSNVFVGHGDPKSTSGTGTNVTESSTPTPAQVSPIQQQPQQTQVTPPPTSSTTPSTKPNQTLDSTQTPSPSIPLVPIAPATTQGTTTQAQIDSNYQQGVSDGITQERQGRKIIVIDDRSSTPVQQVIAGAGGDGMMSSISESALLNNFIKNKLLLDLNYV